MWEATSDVYSNITKIVTDWKRSLENKPHMFVWLVQTIYRKVKEVAMFGLELGQLQCKKC